MPHYKLFFAPSISTSITFVNFLLLSRALRDYTPLCPSISLSGFFGVYGRFPRYRFSLYALCLCQLYFSLPLPAHMRLWEPCIRPCLSHATRLYDPLCWSSITNLESAVIKVCGREYCVCIHKFWVCFLEFWVCGYEFRVCGHLARASNRKFVPVAKKGQGRPKTIMGCLAVTVTVLRRRRGRRKEKEEKRKRKEKKRRKEKKTTKRKEKEEKKKGEKEL